MKFRVITAAACGVLAAGLIGVLSPAPGAAQEPGYWMGHGYHMGPGHGYMHPQGPGYGHMHEYGPGYRMGPGRGQGRGFMMFGTIDQNEDGVITADEAAARWESVFAAMDSDGDGALTEDEYMGVRMGPGSGWGPHHEGRQESKRARFKTMDKDEDGKVTKAEFIDGGRAQFESADADKDGKVTPWEFRATRRY